MESSKREFVPDRFGMLLWQTRFAAALTIALALLAVIIFGPIFGSVGELLLSIAAGFLGVVFATALTISSSCKPYTIAIQTGYVSGPSRWLGKPVMFKLSEIDRAETNRRKMLHRLFGFRLLVSANDEVILLAEQAFNKPDLKNLLSLLGLETPA